MNRFRSNDRFGESVSVKYRGEGEFKTTGGAIVTLLIQLIVIAYALIQA